MRKNLTTKILLTGMLMLYTCQYSIADSTLIVNNQELELLKDDMREIRRDQLNYKIEKDLLKEVYSSNYETIQIIITLIVGIFAVLSYLGFKGISSVKKEYANELEKLREIKEDFAGKLKKLTDTQETVKGQLSDFQTVNEEQNKKIQILELKEKAGTLFSQKQYQRCLEYVAIGLDLAEDDLELTELKANALLKLKNYSDSLESYKKVLALDPTSSMAIQNLGELLLIVERIEDYDQLIKDKKSYFKSDSNAILTYLESLKLYFKGKEQEFKKLIKNFADKQDLSISKNYIPNWDFSDIQQAIAARPDENSKQILTKFTQYLSGRVNGLDLIKYLNEN